MTGNRRDRLKSDQRARDADAAQSKRYHQVVLLAQGVAKPVAGARANRSDAGHGLDSRGLLGRTELGGL